MADYDVKAAFASIENELIASMMRNLSHHRAQETAEGIQWSQWQVEQLAALQRYKKRNRKQFKGVFAKINDKMEQLITLQRAAGNADQEISILQAAKLGAKLHKATKAAALEGRFAEVNDRKLNALLNATRHDMERAEIAILRRADDAYRKIIFNAQVYANTGAGTYEKAVDMATRDFLARGIQCVRYSNGAQHTLSDYADMALRTASKRAYLQGEGEKRQEWGITTVILNKRGGACPHCAKFCGKVFIDDVWSGGKASDGDYPLLSSAIEQGLYHPRCKDSHTTFFPDLTEEEKPWTKKELDKLEKREQAEQREQYAERQAEKYQRLADFSLDPENKDKYQALAKQWDTETLRSLERQAAQMGVKAEYAKANFNPELAEAVNQSIADVQDMFGRLKCLKGIIEDPDQSSDSYARFNVRTETIYLKDVALSAIMKKMSEDAKRAYAFGWWSSSDTRQVIIHEIGHALWKEHATAEKKKMLEGLRQAEVERVTGDPQTNLDGALKNKASVLMWGAKAKQNLSLYGLVSVDEMVSEALAQNILGEPGELAQKTIFVVMG